MTRYSELYLMEQEARRLAERNLATREEEMAVLQRFIVEHGLEGRLAEWSTGDSAIDLMVVLKRYRSALEVIAGQSQDRLQVMQAKAALDNIGPDAA